MGDREPLSGNDRTQAQCPDCYTEHLPWDYHAPKPDAQTRLAAEEPALRPALEALLLAAVEGKDKLAVWEDGGAGSNAYWHLHAAIEEARAALAGARAAMGAEGEDA